MASTYLTPTAVTRAAAAIFHQKGKLLRRINRQYDAQSPDGRKAGGSIKIRMPNQYTVRTGSVMNVQDVSETSETLTIATQKGVDLNFSDSELALSIEDFSRRILEPALKRLVSEIEMDILTGSINRVANMVDNDGSAISFLNIMQARQKLIENLVPDEDEDLSLLLSPTHVTKYADATKGLFSPVGTVSAQYKDGMVGPVAGVGYVGTSTHLTDLTTGTGAEGDTSYDTDIAAGEATGTTGSTGIHIDTGTATFKAGEIFEIESINAVHPETKVDLGYRKQFVVRDNFAGGGEGDLTFWPISGGDAGIVGSGARQNVSAAAVDGKIIYKIGAGNAEKLTRSLYFHRDFCAVAFADLEDPSRYGAWGSVQRTDEISVRVWRQGDIVNGKFPARLDVLYGYAVIRPETACRIHADG